MPRAAILGAKNSGKTTVFRILTGISESRNEPQAWGEARVFDKRLLALSDLYNPKKTTYVSLSVADFRNDGSAVFSFTPLEVLKCEVLLFVLRCFDDPSVYYPFGDSIDPMKEYQELAADLAIKDLEILEKREQKIQLSLKSAKKAERERRELELAFIARLNPLLEEGLDLRKQNYNENELEFLKNYNLISMKKRMIILNTNDSFSEKITEKVCKELETEGELVLTFDGKLELEMSELSEEEREDFKQEMGVESFSSEKIQQGTFSLLDLVSFFTVGEDECRAWAVRKGIGAREAAGKIHTDLEKGFIRAEVVPHEVVLETGSMKAANKEKLVRLEGADYVLLDGDIMHVRFNV